MMRQISHAYIETDKRGVGLDYFIVYGFTRKLLHLEECVK